MNSLSSIIQASYCRAIFATHSTNTNTKGNDPIENSFFLERSRIFRAGGDGDINNDVHWSIGKDHHRFHQSLIYQIFFWENQRKQSVHCHRLLMSFVDWRRRKISKAIDNRFAEREREKTLVAANIFSFLCREKNSIRKWRILFTVSSSEFFSTPDPEENNKVNSQVRWRWINKFEQSCYDVIEIFMQANCYTLLFWFWVTNNSAHAFYAMPSTLKRQRFRTKCFVSYNYTILITVKYNLTWVEKYWSLVQGQGNFCKIECK